MRLIAALTFSLLTLGNAHPALADAPADKAAILNVIDRFFLALQAGDPDAFEAVLTPHTRTVFVRPDGADPLVGVRDSLSTAKRMREGDWPGFREAYWSPTVLQRGRLATVWLPYVLVRDEGGFSHCGIDQFTLTRTDAWYVDFVSFTIEPTRAACADLGHPSDPSLLRPRFAQMEGLVATPDTNP